MKPPITCKLERGKLIDVQKNFVDTFNWLVECASQLKGVSGIQITGIDKGAPQVSLVLSTGDGIKIVDDKGAKKISANLEAGDGIEITSGSNGALRITNTKESGGGVTEIKGTSGTATDVKKIVFKKANDSNVSFAVSQDGETATVTVGVHWANF